MMLGTKMATRFGPWTYEGESGLLDLVPVPLVGVSEEDTLLAPRNPVVPL